MELRFVHFYPDLMSLYGSWGNPAILRRHLEALGNTVTVDTIRPGEDAQLDGADFLFMGAGTERSQKAALDDVRRFAPAIRAAADRGTAMLFCGTAMQLLGRSITDAEGRVYEGLGVAGFESVQGTQRFVGDVLGQTDLYPEPVVGFMNSCALISGVETPLLRELSMGFGNDRERGPEGYCRNGVFASELTGPLLVKNPPLLRRVIETIYAHRGETLPQEPPRFPAEEESFSTACRELQARLTAKK